MRSLIEKLSPTSAVVVYTPRAPLCLGRAATTTLALEQTSKQSFNLE